MYRGIFLLWWEYYRVKILCEYWDLSVNTDNVIIDYDFKSVYNPQFLLDVDAIKETVDAVSEATEILWNELSEIINGLYDKIQNDTITNESIITELTDSINNMPNFQGEDREEIIAYFSSEEFSALLDEENEKIKNGNTTKEAFTEKIKNGIEQNKKKAYFITMNVKNTIELDLKEIKKEYDVIKKNYPDGSNIDTENLKTIPICVLRTETNQYKISTAYINKDKNRGNISEITFDNSTNKETNIMFTNEGNMYVTLWYTVTESSTNNNLMNTSTSTQSLSYPIYNIEIIRVTPSIVYKQDDKNINYLINYQNREIVSNEIELSGNNVSLRPVFITYKEQVDVKERNIDTLFNRNKNYNYLVNTISSIKFNDEESGKTLDWEDFSINNEFSTYKIELEDNSEVTGRLKAINISPFVTVVRSKDNLETGYYVEDYYSTGAVFNYESKRKKENSMKTGNFNILNTPYQVPIVHYKNHCNVTLRLGEIWEYNGNTSVKETSQPLLYKIGYEVIELGKEFTIETKPNGTILDIVDIRNDDVKGHIEFRQINEPLLSPYLNLITINNSAMSDKNFSTVIKELNEIYETMNVSWQQGKIINIDVKNLDITKVYDDYTIRNAVLSEMRNSPDYKEDQYYMIVTPGLSMSGFAPSNLSENWFFVKPNFDDVTPSHELGHCNGLDEFVVDIGVATRSEAAGNGWQYKNTNVMSYSRLPLEDFYSWQISIIRKRINEQLNKK